MLHQAGNRFNAQELWQQDHDHVLHPYTHFDSFRKDGSLVLVEGDGCYVTDANGRRYFDGIGGMWCVNAGYGRREIAEAMAEQALQLCYTTTFVDVTNAPASRLAAKLAELAPGDLNHVAYATSGSCAVDTAIRLAHYYQSRRGQPSRRYVISRRNSYHGSTYLGMTVGLRDGDQSPHFRYIPDLVHHLSAPYPYRRPEGMSLEAFSDFLVDEFAQTIDRLGAENIACFIAEPAQASGGVCIPPPNYLPRMRELCARHGILFIADEIVTAFGRLGHFFASWDEYGVIPDMILTAKGLTSGYIPLSAVIYSDAVHEVISAADPDAWFTHGFTYSGHPVACAVALKNIEIIQNEKLVERVAELAPHFNAMLKKLEDHPIVGETRSVGLIGALELTRNKAKRERFNESGRVGTICRDHCFNAGLIMRACWDTMVLAPPFCITENEIDEIGKLARQALDKTYADVKAEVA